MKIKQTAKDDWDDNVLMWVGLPLKSAFDCYTQ
jgi:hypothetical protein